MYASQIVRVLILIPVMCGLVLLRLEGASAIVWVLFLIPVMFWGIAMKKIEPFNSMGIIFNTRDVLGCCNGGNQALK